jgi:type VI secretion system protein ImpF
MYAFSEKSATPSVFDRLLDDDPAAEGQIFDRFQSLRQLRKSVGRDVEALLNTRQEALEPLPPGLEVSRSLLSYGLPDFTSLSLLNPYDRNRIRRAIEQAIINFEPRLKRVRVTLEPPREHDRSLRFRIDALLQVNPIREPVTFDAVLQLDTYHYHVQGEG